MLVLGLFFASMGFLLVWIIYYRVNKEDTHEIIADILICVVCLLVGGGLLLQR
jgi:hypothetical protein